jgi:23S rRNA (pseudouridine1915-N3)-methyltransferase
MIIIDDKLESFYLDAIKEYEKRLSKYCKLKIVSSKSAKKIENMVLSSSYSIAVSTSGKNISSEELASKIEQFGIDGQSNINLFIGNSENLQYNEVISLSKMEMSLGLQSTVAIEQIYRAFRIIHNHSYHK